MVLADGDESVSQRRNPTREPDVRGTASAPTERALLWVQERRVALTIAVGLAIAAAAFFAYRSQGVDVLSDSAAASGPPASDALASPVAETSEDDRSIESTDGEEPPSAAADTGASRSDTKPMSDERSATSPPTTALVDTDGSTTSALGSTLTTEDTTPEPTSTTTTLTTSSTTTTTMNPPSTDPPLPVTIGGRVSVGGGGGEGYGGLPVALHADPDRNGVADQVIATTTTGSDGAYAFTAQAGCYVAVFALPDGATVLAGQRRSPLCLGSGESNRNLDLAISIARPPPPPPACDVQIGNNRFAGVEIRDPSRNWAASYIFYGASGEFILDTATLGPPDDTTNPDRNQIEWTSQFHNYEESIVYSVAAVGENGQRSNPVSCSRRFV